MTHTPQSTSTSSPVSAAAPSAHEAGAAPAARPSMLARASATAALVKALTYVIGFVVMGAYLGPRGFSDAQGDPSASFDVLSANAGTMYAWYLVLYLVGGLALVVLAQGMHDRLARRAPALAGESAILGYLWAGLLLASGLIALVGQTAVLELASADHAQAVTAWASVSIVQDALGGGIEVVGGAWALVIGWAGFRTRELSASFSLNALAIGALGVLTVVPSLTEVMTVSFGITFVVWFIWASVVLWRGAARRP